jgi:hypothetical protein
VAKCPAQAARPWAARGAAAGGILPALGKVGAGAADATKLIQDLRAANSLFKLSLASPKSIMHLGS